MAHINQDPIDLFAEWFAEAQGTSLRDPTAMALATVAEDLTPAVRMVLMKNFDQEGLVFYTNTTSIKAHDLSCHPQASCCFYWEALHKQVRVTGGVGPVTVEEADAYFASRPRQSQLGAWASLQSQPMKARAEFEERLALVTQKYQGGTVPRPPHWSGYRLVPLSIEFWTERPFRLHERVVFRRSSAKDAWMQQILYP